MSWSNRFDLAAVVARQTCWVVLSGHIHATMSPALPNTFFFTTPAVLYIIDPGVQSNFLHCRQLRLCDYTIQGGQLFMNTIMMSSDETELEYRQALDL
ncbi:MAG: hypothetical protein R3E79_16440 [Caldilineaceae bacterium]